MESILNNLLDILKKEFDMYKALLSVLREERRLLTSVSLDKFNDCLKAKEDLMLRVSMLEESRMQLTKALAQKLNLPLEEVTLSYLSCAAEEPFSSAFKSLKAGFSSLTADIKDVNSINRQFLQRYLHIIQSSLSVLNRLISPNLIYLKTGQFSHKYQRGKVISGKV